MRDTAAISWPSRIGCWSAHASSTKFICATHLLLCLHYPHTTVLCRRPAQSQRRRLWHPQSSKATRPIYLPERSVDEVSWVLGALRVAVAKSVCTCPACRHSQLLYPNIQSVSALMPDGERWSALAGVCVASLLYLRCELAIVNISESHY